MPEVHLARPPMAAREYIPWLWIYTPVVVKWMMLALRYRSLTLPTAVNPGIDLGGFSKAAYLMTVGPDSRRWFARTTSHRVPIGGPLLSLPTAEARMAEAGLTYPLIVKPDVGICGHGVRLVRARNEMSAYLAAFPSDETVILQEFVPWAGEAAILYIRHPRDRRGQIYSLALRYHPQVTGDGRSTLRQLIRRDPRASRRMKLHSAALGTRLDEVPKDGAIVRLCIPASLRVGALYKDGSAYATSSLAERMDQIARSMPQFHYGRFDVRFKDVQSLSQGKDFLIVEVNGAGSEASHVWDPELTIRDAYRVWCEQLEILFRIGAYNRALGAQPLSFRQLIALEWRALRLLRLYPPSN